MIRKVLRLISAAVLLLYSAAVLQLISAAAVMLKNFIFFVAF